MNKNFKEEVKYRLVRLGLSQRELAEKMNISTPYLSQIINEDRESVTVECKKELILKTLDELESRCLIEK